MSKTYPFFTPLSKKTPTATANENDEPPNPSPNRSNTSQNPTTTNCVSEPDLSLSSQPKRLAIHTPQSPCKSISPSSIIAALDKRKPISPELEEYPKTKFGKETFDRGFSKQWYINREWLEYIVELDACLCYPCRVCFDKWHPVCKRWFQILEECHQII